MHVNNSTHFIERDLGSNQAPKIPAKSQLSAQRDTFSTLQSAKKGGGLTIVRNLFFMLIRPFGRFFAYIGRTLQSTICCCLRFKPPFTYYDWKTDYDISAALITAVNMKHLGDGQKKLDESLNKLCEEAKKRLDRLIGCAIAKERNSSLVDDRPGQEEWYLENRLDIDFKHYYTLYGNDSLLKSCLTEFHEESARGAGLPPIKFES